MRPPPWFDADDDRGARAAWSRLAEPGDVGARRLVAEHGAGAALRKVLEEDPGPQAARWRVRLEHTDPRRDLRTLTGLGGHLLVPQDAGWPGGLADLGVDQPFCLWTRGRHDLARACGQSVAMVGTRTPTHYGLEVAARLAVGCVEAGVSVVSGGAYGIDAGAHRAALAADGVTVAVLACGVDRAYPRGNERLITQIAAQGALVSEVPPGSAPTRWRFLERNRLIAALTGATVVVEAAWRSGAQSTARHAVQLARPVGAVPGPVTSALSAGCHRLLRDGAVCVTDAAEVLELTRPVGQGVLDLPDVPRRPHDGLSAEQILVLDALPVRAWAGIEGLTQAAGLPHGEVLAGLGRLLGLGLAENVGGRWRRATGST
jgi:DNA processing protein